MFLPARPALTFANSKGPIVLQGILGLQALQTGLWAEGGHGLLCCTVFQQTIEDHAGLLQDATLLCHHTVQGCRHWRATWRRQVDIVCCMTTIAPICIGFLVSILAFGNIQVLYTPQSPINELNMLNARFTNVRCILIMDIRLSIILLPKPFSLLKYVVCKSLQLPLWNPGIHDPRGSPVNSIALIRLGSCEKWIWSFPASNRFMSQAPQVDFRILFLPFLSICKPTRCSWPAGHKTFCSTLLLTWTIYFTSAT